MIQFDTHIHTYPFSPDSHQDIAQVVSANKTCPYGFILTEHMDYLYPGTTNFEFSPKKYFETYGPFRNDRFLLGVEMGMQLNNLSMINKTVSEYPFDMVIGSIHTVDGEDIAYPSFSETYHKEEAYQKYLISMLDCLKQHPDIDTLAHIDYICRYSSYKDPELHIIDHKTALEAIFNFIIENNICLEINTRRIADENGYNTLNELLRLYAFLDGRYVTVGSDSHKPQNLAMNFHLAEQLIHQHNLIPVYFKNRKRIE